MLNRVVSIISGVIVMVLFVVLLDTHAAVNPDFTPKWQVGDSWEMVFREASLDLISPGELQPEIAEKPYSRVLYIHFEIIERKVIDGEMCYVIEISYKHPTVEYDRNAVLQLYVREDDFTLKRILEITKRSDGTTHIDNFHDNGRDFVIFLDPFCISILSDFPNLPRTNTNEERSIEHPEFGLMTQKVTFINDNTVEIVLSTENNGGLLKITQIWQKGKPWWSSVNRTFTYKDYETGEEKTRVEYDNVLVGTDTTPPDLKVSVSPTTLWPPNYEMVEITPTITITDDYDRFPEVKVYSVESNEPDDTSGAGDGHTTRDIEITEDGTILFLRAERDGKGDGRIYTITYTATDASGNTSSASAIVTVPHDAGEEEKE